MERATIAIILATFQEYITHRVEVLLFRGLTDFGPSPQLRCNNHVQWIDVLE